jgi:hypothetical protein
MTKVCDDDRFSSSHRRHKRFCDDDEMRLRENVVAIACDDGHFPSAHHRRIGGATQVGP